MPTRLIQLHSHDIGCAYLQVVGPVAVRFSQTRTLQIAILLPGSVDRFLDPSNVADPWTTSVNWFAPGGASFDNGQLGIELGYAVTYQLQANQPYRLLLRAEGSLEAEERFTGIGNIRRPSSPPPDWVPPPVPQSSTPELTAWIGVAPSEVRAQMAEPSVPAPAPAPVPVSVATLAAASRTELSSFCPQCGATLNPGNTFCTSCGTPVDATILNISPDAHLHEILNEFQATPQADRQPALRATHASAADITARKQTDFVKREGSVDIIVLGIVIAFLISVVIAFSDSWTVDSGLRAEAQELQQIAERERREQETRSEQQRAEEVRRILDAENRARAVELAAEERRAQEQAAEEVAEQQREAEERAAAHRAQQERETQEQAEIADVARQRALAADAQRSAGLGAISRILLEGERCFEANRFDCAIASASAVILINPSDLHALDLRARAADSQRRALADVQIR